MFPATATSRPAARKIAPSSAVVVVFPFVPVTPTKRVPAGSSRKPSSTSDQTGTPRSRAAATSGRSRAARRASSRRTLDAVEQREVVLVPERPVDRHDLVAALREPLRRRRARSAPRP